MGACRALKPGDRLRTQLDNWIEVERIENSRQIEPVFNLQVEKAHTFFVQLDTGAAVLVHNDSGVDLDAQSMVLYRPTHFGTTLPPTQEYFFINGKAYHVKRYLVRTARNPQITFQGMGGILNSNDEQALSDARQAWSSSHGVNIECPKLIHSGIGLDIYALPGDEDPDATKSIGTAIEEAAKEKKSIGEPPPGIAMIPFIGNGWAFIHDIQVGHGGAAIFHAVMFALDVFLVKSLVTAPLKEAMEEVSQQAVRGLEEMTAPVEEAVAARTGPYASLAKELKSTGLQANHVNQNAAFKSIIAKDEGLAVGMRGNAFKDVGTPHYNFHKSLEEFWELYRTGPLRGQRPTSAEYGQALERALKAGDLTESEASRIAAEAAQQRRAAGLADTDLVPRIPRPMNQSGG